jgi:hypothetical protein
MIIEFGLSHAFSPDSDPVDNAQVLRLLLESLVAIDRAYLRRHSAPALYKSGVTYGRTRIWESIPDALLRGRADCKTLSAWKIAEDRNKGISVEPAFRWITNSQGQRDYHILLEYKDHWEDPSKILGMEQYHSLMRQRQSREF